MIRTCITRLALVVTICLGVHGQNTGQNVVTQNLINAASSYDPGFGTIDTAPIAQNVGQTNHVITGSTGTISGTPSCTLEMTASNDGTNYFLIGQSTNKVMISNTVLRVYGFGAFPYLKPHARCVSGGPNHIALNVTYAGTSIPSNNIVDVNGAALAMTYGNFTASTGAFRSSFMPNTGTQAYLYGLVISSDATATSIEFYCDSAGGNPVLVIGNLGTVRNVVIAPSLRPLVGCASGTMFYQLFGGGVVTVSSVTRYDP